MHESHDDPYNDHLARARVFDAFRDHPELCPLATELVVDHQQKSPTVHAMIFELPGKHTRYVRATFEKGRWTRTRNAIFPMPQAERERPTVVTVVDRSYRQVIEKGATPVRPSSGPAKEPTPLGVVPGWDARPKWSPSY